MGSSILLDYFGPDQGSSTVIGFSRKSTIQNAALLNGMSAHVAELDDGERLGMVHPGAPVISALFSVAEHEKLNWGSIQMYKLQVYRDVIKNRYGKTNSKCR